MTSPETPILLRSLLCIPQGMTSASELWPHCGLDVLAQVWPHTHLPAGRRGHPAWCPVLRRDTLLAPLAAYPHPSLSARLHAMPTPAAGSRTKAPVGLKPLRGTSASRGDAPCCGDSHAVRGRCCPGSWHRLPWHSFHGTVCHVCRTRGSWDSFLFGHHWEPHASTSQKA